MGRADFVRAGMVGTSAADAMVREKCIVNLDANQTAQPPKVAERLQKAGYVAIAGDYLLHRNGMICTPDAVAVGAFFREDSEHIERFAAAINLTEPAAFVTDARPRDEWHEDMGSVLWWFFPICEPPYVGTPLDCLWAERDWDNQYTHFTPIPIPGQPHLTTSPGDVAMQALEALDSYLGIGLDADATAKCAVIIQRAIEATSPKL